MFETLNGSTLDRRSFLRASGLAVGGLVDLKTEKIVVPQLHLA